MSSKHPREAIEEVEEAAFAMQEELKEAVAAVGGVLSETGKEGRAGGDATSGQAHDGEGA
jgi:hypothetical protein